MHTQSYTGNEYLVVRVMYNKVDKKKYLDIRIFEMGNGVLKKTDKGVYLPIQMWDEVKQCLNEIHRRIK